MYLLFLTNSTDNYYYIILYIVSSLCIYVCWYALPSAPIDTNFTPLLAIKSSALLTLAILWKRILPLSGFGKVSPEMTSKSNISLRPLRKSSSMFSIAVPALRKCELHHAVKVYKMTEKNTILINLFFSFNWLN